MACKDEKGKMKKERGERKNEKGKRREFVFLPFWQSEGPLPPPGFAVLPLSPHLHDVTLCDRGRAG